MVEEQSERIGEGIRIADAKSVHDVVEYGMVVLAGAGHLVLFCLPKPSKPSWPAPATPASDFSVSLRLGHRYARPKRKETEKSELQNNCYTGKRVVAVEPFEFGARLLMIRASLSRGFACVSQGRALEFVPAQKLSSPFASVSLPFVRVSQTFASEFLAFASHFPRRRIGFGSCAACFGGLRIGYDECAICFGGCAGGFGACGTCSDNTAMS